MTAQQPPLARPPVDSKHSVRREKWVKEAIKVSSPDTSASQLAELYDDLCIKWDIVMDTSNVLQARQELAHMVRLLVCCLHCKLD